MRTKTREAPKVRATYPSYKIPLAFRDADNIPDRRRPFAAIRNALYFEWIKTLLIRGIYG
jgi:hypothetical protein